MSAVGGFLIPVLGTTIPGIAFLRLLQGLGAGFVLAAPPRIASEWFPMEERGTVTGIQGAAIGLGVTVGLVISPAVFAKTGSWAVTLALMGILPAVGFVMSIIMELGPKAPAIVPVNPQTTEEPDSQNDFKLVLKQPAFYIVTAALFAFSYIQQGCSVVFPGYMAVDPDAGLGFGSQVAGNLYSLYSVAFTVGALLSGIIGRYLFKNNLKVSISVGFIFATIFNASILIPAVYSNRSVLLVCLILAGFFLAWCSPMIFAYLTQCYPTSIMGRVGGLMQGIGTMGAPH